MERLEKIMPNESQIKILYNLLQKRSYSISHKENPSYEQHQNFVENNPYRHWFLAIYNSEYVGAIYVKDDNSIGINIDNCIEPGHINNFINIILDEIEPLPAIPSVRAAGFHINLAPNNDLLRTTLDKRGCSLIQITYLLENK